MLNVLQAPTAPTNSFPTASFSVHLLLLILSAPHNRDGGFAVGLKQFAWSHLDHRDWGDDLSLRIALRNPVHARHMSDTIDKSLASPSGQVSAINHKRTQSCSVCAQQPAPNVSPLPEQATDAHVPSLKSTDAAISNQEATEAEQRPPRNVPSRHLWARHPRIRVLPGPRHLPRTRYGRRRDLRWRFRARFVRPDDVHALSIR